MTHSESHPRPQGIVVLKQPRQADPLRYTDKIPQRLCTRQGLDQATGERLASPSPLPPRMPSSWPFHPSVASRLGPSHACARPHTKTNKQPNKNTHTHRVL